MRETQRVFIGLGNPGQRYVHTRHNFGFFVVEELAKQLGISWKENKTFNAMTAKGCYNEVEIHLLLPLTYMNVSGEAVREYLSYYKLTPDQIIVVCDDVALELGQLRLRAQGSSGGHNGLKSIAASLDTEGFARLRMGIGNNKENQSLADYVLSDFRPDEFPALNQSIKNGADTLKLLINEPITYVMNQVNTLTL